MKTVAFLKTAAVVLPLLFTGCVVSRPHLIETTRDTNGVVTTRELWLTSYSIWPGTQSIEKQNAGCSQEKACGSPQSRVNSFQIASPCTLPKFRRLLVQFEHQTRTHPWA